MCCECRKKLQRCAKKQTRFLSNIIFIPRLMNTINPTHLSAVIKSSNEHFATCSHYLHIFMTSSHVANNDIISNTLPIQVFAGAWPKIFVVKIATATCLILYALEQVFPIEGSHFDRCIAEQLVD